MAPKTRKTIILSRHFEENVQLVANMCINCYKQEEVKVIGINKKFIELIQLRRNRLNTSEPPCNHDLPGVSEETSEDSIVSENNAEEIEEIFGDDTKSLEDASFMAILNNIQDYFSGCKDFSVTAIKEDNTNISSDDSSEETINLNHFDCNSQNSIYNEDSNIENPTKIEDKISSSSLTETVIVNPQLSSNINTYINENITSITELENTFELSPGILSSNNSKNEENTNIPNENEHTPFSSINNLQKTSEIGLQFASDKHITRIENNSNKSNQIEEMFTSFSSNTTLFKANTEVLRFIKEPSITSKSNIEETKSKTISTNSNINQFKIPAVKLTRNIPNINSFDTNKLNLTQNLLDTQTSQSSTQHLLRQSIHKSLNSKNSQLYNVPSLKTHNEKNKNKLLTNVSNKGSNDYIIKLINNLEGPLEHSNENKCTEINNGDISVEASENYSNVEKSTNIFETNLNEKLEFWTRRAKLLESLDTSEFSTCKNNLETLTNVNNLSGTSIIESTNSNLLNPNIDSLNKNNVECFKTTQNAQSLKKHNNAVSSEENLESTSVSEVSETEEISQYFAHTSEDICRETTSLFKEIQRSYPRRLNKTSWNKKNAVLPLEINHRSEDSLSIENRHFDSSPFSLHVLPKRRKFGKHDSK